MKKTKCAFLVLCSLMFLCLPGCSEDQSISENAGDDSTRNAITGSTVAANATVAEGENDNQSSSYLGDFTHDGTEDILELKPDKIKNPDDENESTVLLKSDAEGKILWGLPVNTVHAGWAGVYSYSEKGEEYLMVFQPVMYQGMADYKYRIFYVDESGKEIVLHSNRLKFDLNHPKETDADNLRSFVKEVNQYLGRADLIISTLEGEVKTGEDIENEDLTFDASETLKEMENASR